MCHAMPFSACALKKIFFDVAIAIKKQIECGVSLSVLLSTTIRVVTVVKILLFDHCGDAYSLSIIVQMLNHIRFVNRPFAAGDT